VARAKSQPARKIIDGVEYFSAQAAANTIGRSSRTLTRLEKSGVPRRPHPRAGGEKLENDCRTRPSHVRHHDTNRYKALVKLRVGGVFDPLSTPPLLRGGSFCSRRLTCGISRIGTGSPRQSRIQPHVLADTSPSTLPKCISCTLRYASRAYKCCSDGVSKVRDPSGFIGVSWETGMTGGEAASRRVRSCRRGRARRGAEGDHPPHLQR
jgi:hypothetical protein